MNSLPNRPPNSNPNVVLLNGPPGCGKDTIADMIVRKVERSAKMKFAAPLKNAAHALLRGLECFADLGAQLRLPPVEQYSTTKDRPMYVMGKATVTMRDLYIAISEQLVKPMFGEEYFGAALCREIVRSFEQDENALYVVSDSGFASEARPLIDCPSMNVHYVRVERPGTTFQNDSRGYWLDYLSPAHRQKLASTATINNDKGLAELEAVVDSMFDANPRP